MSKIELDDQILDHPKFVRAVKLGGSDTFFLWAGLRSYCSKLLTDGFIPDDMLDEVRGPKDQRKRSAALEVLKTVNLVEDCDGGVRLHDYLDWASSRDDVLRWRARARERQAKSRGMSQRDNLCDSPSDNESDDTSSHEPRVRARVAPTSPSPTTSQSTKENQKEIPLSPPGRKRSTRETGIKTICPELDEFQISKATENCAAELSVDWQKHFAKMFNWSHANGQKRSDWNAALRNFMLGNPNDFRIVAAQSPLFEHRAPSIDVSNDPRFA